MSQDSRKKILITGPSLRRRLSDALHQYSRRGYRTSSLLSVVRATAPGEGAVQRLSSAPRERSAASRNAKSSIPVTRSVQQPRRVESEEQDDVDARTCSQEALITQSATENAGDTTDLSGAEISPQRLEPNDSPQKSVVNLESKDDSEKMRSGNGSGVAAAVASHRCNGAPALQVLHTVHSHLPQIVRPTNPYAEALRAERRARHVNSSPRDQIDSDSPTPSRPFRRNGRAWLCRSRSKYTSNTGQIFWLEGDSDRVTVTNLTALSTEPSHARLATLRLELILRETNRAEKQGIMAPFPGEMSLRTLVVLWDHGDISKKRHLTVLDEENWFATVALVCDRRGRDLLQLEFHVDDESS